MRFHDEPEVRWTESEISLLKKYYIEKKSITQISSKLHRAEDAVVIKLIKLNILGYGYEKHVPNRHGHNWSHHEISQLKEEFQSGMSVEEIARVHRRLKKAILIAVVRWKLIDISDRNELKKYRYSKMRARIRDILDNWQKYIILYILVTVIAGVIVYLIVKWLHLT